ncbi:MAG: site-2 protease family protein [Candidatus Acidiferrales bacterium]
MPDSGLKIGRIFGIPIYLHASWFIIFALITFSLVTQFGNAYPQWSERQRWMLGVATSLLFFGSVLFHELAHSVVAQRYKIPVISITLFVFGGVARIGREAPTAKQEFNIAIAGPLASFFLSGTFFLLTLTFPQKEMLGALAGWLWEINFALAAFNLVPGFPLDGGRILRALVWAATKDYNRASRIAATGGKIVAYAMILVGVWVGLAGNLVGGLWLALIGWFLLNAAQASYAQVAIRNALTGLRASDVMNADVPVVRRDISIEDYAKELLQTGRRCHLVVDDGRLVGMMTVHAAGKVPRDDWPVTSIQHAMLPLDKVRHTRVDEPLLAVLERMQADDVNQMPVVSDGRVVGLISRDSILRMIQTRLELGALS